MFSLENSVVIRKPLTVFIKYLNHIWEQVMSAKTTFQHTEIHQKQNQAVT